jgi:Flp pilus assembly protein TadG
MRRERGSVAVELAVVAPALMLLVLGVLQFGLWYHAQNVVQTAAQEGARTAAAENGTAETGQARALELLQEGLGNAGQNEDAVASLDQTRHMSWSRRRCPGCFPSPG